MPAVMRITPPGGQEPGIRIGRLPRFQVHLPSATGHGSTVRRPVELSFPRELGGQANDEVDQLFFKLHVGAGRGEVQKFTATITVHNQAGSHVADLVFAGASMLWQRETDAHPAPVAEYVIVADQLTYTPEDGDPIVY